MSLPKPYYQADGQTIYHADCRHVLPFLPKFDLLLTDPPYGLGHKLHEGGTWATNPIYDAMTEWDLSPTPDDLIALAISKAETCIVWGGNYYSLPPSRCWLSWVKLEQMNTMADFELAWTNRDANSKKFTERRNPDGKRRHPTQKPESLMSWCLSLVPEVKTALDAYCGSGTTLVAAKQRGIQATGIDINERYCEIAANRLAQGVLITA